MSESNMRVYLYRLLDDLENDLIFKIYNRSLLISRAREDVSAEQLQELRDFLVQKAYLDYVSHRVRAVLNWSDLL